MKKIIILKKDCSLDCRVLLEESDLWLGREAIELNNREATERVEMAHRRGEGVFFDNNNVIRINY